MSEIIINYFMNYWYQRLSDSQARILKNKIGLQISIFIYELI